MIEIENNTKVENNESMSYNSDGLWSHMKKTMTNAEIMSNSVFFLAAGFESTASTLSFISYNLATNPGCQELLCNEIDQVLEKYVRLLIILILLRKNIN